MGLFKRLVAAVEGIHRELHALNRAAGGPVQPEPEAPPPPDAPYKSQRPWVGNRARRIYHVDEGAAWLNERTQAEKDARGLR